ncbi:DNA cytosine methyltransferase [Kocuria sp. LUK]|uniref:DNA cytosine methyltransferase n=1 Tax=Kocuria sp. LUK TaxID=2897828 RepID=UPI001E2C9B6A|nr:DNA cytosine methyltransferase [Kocuria sp. LUK]MCD1144248.1 DNA cytosine methyltransferase [Kocuria sp. LUK]
MSTPTLSPSDASPGVTSGPSRVRPLEILDVFAGAGGLSQGFHEASDRYKVVRAVEMNPEAAASYAENFGDVVYNGTIQDWLDDEFVPSAHIVLGGPPCQGFSTLGKQEENDVRNTLWRYYARTVREAQPLYFVMENVPAFLTSPQFPLLQKETSRGGALEDYAFEARVLNAAQYGAAQVRKRVIVIGHHRSVPAPGFPEPTHPTVDSWVSLREVIGNLNPVVTSLRPENRRTVFGDTRFDGPFRADELHLTRRYQDISLARFHAIPQGGSRKDLPEDLKMECWRKHTKGSMDVMGRLRWDRPSVTVRTEFTKPEKGRYLHPEQPRAITIHEGSRIQGFPDDYKFVGSLTQITKQIGNAVPIPLGRALGQHIAARISPN